MQYNKKTRSLLEEQVYKEISENMKAVKEGKKFRLVQKLVFTKDEEVLSNLKNANYYEALTG